MANSITKLEIFQQLIKQSDLFVNLRDALVSLKDELTDNDEKNIKIVEKWLQDKPEIKRKYAAKLMQSGDKAIAGGESNTKPGEKTESLIKTIEQAVQVDDTDKSSPKPPPAV